jgi:hypothetical protein
MRPVQRTIVYGVVASAWVLAVGAGLAKLWVYEGTPGAGARAPRVWAAEAGFKGELRMPELVVLIHPHCPCSRATIGELAKLMARCSGRLHATVVVVRPAGVEAGWERSDLWLSAAAIPGVSVMADEGGREAQRFGGATSGQALLYGASGQLLFAGGITESRGHSGDNAGSSAIDALVFAGGVVGEAAHTPVYGCPLFDGVNDRQTEGTKECLH